MFLNIPLFILESWGGGEQIVAKKKVENHGKLGKLHIFTVSPIPRGSL